MVLTHDLFLSKKGIALPQTHGLCTSVARHKARLSAELTKARLRRGCATLDELRASINQQVNQLASGPGGSISKSRHPRWVRISTIRTSLEEQLVSTFADYTPVPTLGEVASLDSGSDALHLHIDKHIPNLIAIPPHIELTSSKAYKEGKLILQDKASCFPAYLLDPKPGDGDIVDACAAPGNKTTHLAAVLHDRGSDSGMPRSKIIACEKDATRSLTLQKMVKLACGEKVITVKAKQDFMKLDPMAKEFSNVTALLLDPSCSGSGIVGRDGGGVIVHLPNLSSGDTVSKGKKRKRGSGKSQPAAEPSSTETVVEETPTLPENDTSKLQTRLENLSSFQLRLLERAMAFPAAKCITYSTCSIHAEENEHVVMNALISPIALERGWRIMRKSEQVDGMRRWQRRGWKNACRKALEQADGGHDDAVDADEAAEGCIRCEKGSDDGTIGFFVAGFVREADVNDGVHHSANGCQASEHAALDDDDSEDDWDGFDDDP